MDIEWREQRRQELLEIRSASPAKLVALYKHVHGLDEFKPLPETLTIEAVIEAILDREGITRLSGPDTTNN